MKKKKGGGVWGGGGGEGKPSLGRSPSGINLISKSFLMLAF